MTSDDRKKDGSRARMVAGAAQLLAKRGLHATSFTEVLDVSGAPRGSVYHHFPEGKDQMVGSAIEFTGAYLLGLLDAKAGASALEVSEYFIHVWRTVLTRSQFEAGCAIAAVTVATDSVDLLDRTAAVFRAWRMRLAELLVQGGLGPKDAKQFAVTLIAACEGAVVLGRAERSTEPLDLVGKQLIDQLKRMLKPK